ncbi:SdiA-regulated domain-containing protein [Oceanisphaera ostreae]|uniref:SdiA-regulated domain-containing protein n=1 Tax=Oceanisphaera ostreae TaxID=914151 RepID=A0ABW3KE62_9GAMM
MRILVSLYWIFVLGGCATAQEQSLVLDTVATFDTRLSETSGLIRWQQGFITHNDSGNDAELFMLTANGDLIARLPVAAGNHDWEDIAVQGNTLYVADIGNNNGRRPELSILPLTLEQNKVQVHPSLPVAYAEQTHFQPAPYQHNFDAEALTWVEDDLWLFTKRWLDQQTAIYTVPTIGKPRPLQAHQQLNTQMLVTGADFDTKTNTLLLLGYSRNWWHRTAWIWLYPVQEGRVLERQGLRFRLSERGQFEGIALGQDRLIYVTREGHNTNLFRSRVSLAALLAHSP